LRAWIYDKAIVSLTSGWYAEVLARLPNEARLLDVGIGTGGALAKNAPVIFSKKLQVTGVDIDPDYVRRASAVMAKSDLQNFVDVRLESIYDHKGGPYDAIYFSASFMLMPDPAGALRHVSPLLVDGGLIFFTQTFQERPSPFLEKAKPLLKKVTTIEFGSVTYEDAFQQTVAAGGVEILNWKALGRQGARAYRMAVGRPVG
jgi:SAM-dependent methyltransferase